MTILWLLLYVVMDSAYFFSTQGYEEIAAISTEILM